MRNHVGRCALLIALLPAMAWAQESCVKPELPDTEVDGWHESEWGSIISGTARYSIPSNTKSSIDKITLGIFFSHGSNEESHAKGVPTIRELPDLMTASMQVRFVLKDRNRPRGWDADEADVLLDGKRFNTRMSVIGAPDRTNDIAANWEVWFSDKDLLAAMENASEMEVRMRHTPTASSGTYTFDLSSFKGVRAQLIPYWRCTSVPYHRTHRH